MTGREGKDIIIEVPLGTIAKDEETGEIEAEVLHDGQEVVWVRGGRGGRAAAGAQCHGATRPGTGAARSSARFTRARRTWWSRPSGAMPAHRPRLWQAWNSSSRARCSRGFSARRVSRRSSVPLLSA